MINNKEQVSKKITVCDRVKDVREYLRDHKDVKI